MSLFGQIQTPISSALNQLSATKASELYTNAYEKRAKEVLEEALNLYPFALSEKSKVELTRRGISLPPSGYLAHSHPVSKTVENYMLYVVLLDKIKDENHVLFLSTKNHKAIKITKLINNHRAKQAKTNLVFGEHIKILNSDVVPVDRIRYGNLRKLEGTVYPDKYKDPIPHDAECIVTHDLIHHWGLSNIIEFLEYKHPKRMLATLVIPPELLQGGQRSINPWMYTFRVIGDSFLYCPDGNTESAYEQRMDSVELLKLARIQAGSNYYSVTKLSSIGAAHLFLFERGIHVVDKRRIFGNNEFVTPELMKALPIHGLEVHLRREILEKVLIYTMALGSPNEASSVAKMRTLESDPDISSAYAIQLVTKFQTKEFQNRMLELSLTRDFKDKIKSSMPRWFQYLFLRQHLINRTWEAIIPRVHEDAIIIECTTSEIKTSKQVYPKSSPYSLGPYKHCIRCGGTCTGHFRLSAKYQIENPVLDLLSINPLYQIMKVIYTKKMFLKNEPENSAAEEPVEGVIEMSTEEKKVTDMVMSWVLENVTESIHAESSQKGSKTGSSEEKAKSWASEASDDTSPDILGEQIMDMIGIPLNERRKVRKDNQDFGTNVGPQIWECLGGKTLMSEEEKIMNNLKKHFYQPFTFFNDQNKCLLHAICSIFNERIEDLVISLKSDSKSVLNGWLASSEMADNVILSLVALKLDLTIHIEHDEFEQPWTLNPGRPETAIIRLQNEHFEAVNYMLKPPEKMMKIEIPVDLEEAEIFKKELLSHNYGVVPHTQEIVMNPNPVRGWLDLGCGGSGKSYEVIKRLNDRKRTKKDVLYVVPFKRLGDRIQKDIRNPVVKIKTLELALNSKLDKFVEIVIDEVFAYPKGYLHYLLAMTKRSTIMTFIGDPIQCDGHVPLNDTINSLSCPIRNFLQQGIPFDYRVNNNRLPKNIALQLGYNPMRSDSVNNPRIIELTRCEFSQYEICLAASDDMVQTIKAKYGIETCTYKGYQGETSNGRYLIYLDSDSFIGERYHLNTALTRGRMGFDFAVSEFSDPEGTKLEMMQRGVLNADGTLASIVKQLTTRYPNARLRGNLKGGKTQVMHVGFKATDNSDVWHGVSKEQKVGTDQYYKAMIDLEQHVDVLEPLEIEPVAEMVKLPTHIPNEPGRCHKTRLLEHMKATELREAFHPKIGFTNQFQDSKINDNLETQAYPYHRPRDLLTELMGMWKRISWSTVRRNKLEYEAAGAKGDKLLRAYCDFTGVKPMPFDPELMQKCKDDFYKKKFSWPEARFDKFKERSDPDWNISAAKLFQKVQHCTKIDNEFMNAKASQIIACFHHKILTHFAWIPRYMAAKMKEVMSSNIYIHCKTTEEDLNEWAHGVFYGQPVTTNDYTAYDASQNGDILDFEVKKQRYIFSIPEEFIQDYIYFKLHLSTKDLIFAIIRFTGEPGTFNFNTDASIAFVALRFKNVKGSKIAFAGDDMVCDRVLEEDPEQDKFFESLKLKAKTIHTTKPTFCSWNLVKEGIYKNPSILKARIDAAKANGTLKEKIISYSLEAGFGYRMGDNLTKYLDEREMEEHQMLVRTCIKEGEKYGGEIGQSVSEIFSTKQCSGLGARMHYVIKSPTDHI